MDELEEKIKNLFKIMPEEFKNTVAAYEYFIDLKPEIRRVANDLPIDSLPELIKTLEDMIEEVKKINKTRKSNFPLSEL